MLEYWQELTSPDFAALDPERTVALLPVAAVEQHGPHLPLGTDALLNAAFVNGLFKRYEGSACLLVLPPQTVGHSLEHANFDGTLTLSLETLLHSWIEIAGSAARAGIRKLIILNTHGGQSSLVHLAAVRMRAELGLLVVRANYFALGMPPGLFDAEELAWGLHGGEVETSLMLHLHPELVRRERIDDFRGLTHDLAASNRLLRVEKPVGLGWMSEDLHPSGAIGNAARADANRGRQLFDYLVGELMCVIDELRATPLSILKTR